MAAKAIFSCLWLELLLGGGIPGVRQPVVFADFCGEPALSVPRSDPVVFCVGMVFLSPPEVGLLPSSRQRFPRGEIPNASFAIRGFSLPSSAFALHPHVSHIAHFPARRSEDREARGSSQPAPGWAVEARPPARTEPRGACGQPLPPNLPLTLQTFAKCLFS